MLKIIYAETGQHLEPIPAESPAAKLRQRDEWVVERLKFAQSIGQTLLVSQERATFMLPNSIGNVTEIDNCLNRLGAKTIAVDWCDLGWVEIELAGSWIYTDVDRAEGVFIAEQPEPVESYLLQLWEGAKVESVTYEPAMTHAEQIRRMNDEWDNGSGE
jgi:hypothetical protein